MSTAYTESGGQSFNAQDSKVFTWNLAANETGDALAAPAYADRSVQMYGTFGGATVVWEGSNEPDTPAPSNYKTLTDPLGNGVSKTQPGLSAITEATRLGRPRISGGDGTTAITIILFVKR